jgi:hypothetical protein
MTLFNLFSLLRKISNAMEDIVRNAEFYVSFPFCGYASEQNDTKIHS